MKKILLFGATGDTGKYFVKYYYEQQHNEYELIAIGSRDEGNFGSCNVRYIKVDITKKEDFSKLPDDVYAVIDLAGAMPARMEGYNPYKYIDVNIVGTLNILEYCREKNVDRILFSQSFGDIKDYGEEEVVLKVDMDRKFSFNSDHTIYVMSKNFAVDMIKNYHEAYGLKGFIFRLPTIYLYSPIDTYYVDGKLRKIGYRLLIEKAQKGENIEVWGDPSRVKDMVYVKDFCQMIYKACFVDLDFGYYNVGTGIGISLFDQIKGIVEVFCDKNNISEISMRPDLPNAPQYIMDISAAVEELGYKPQYDYLTMLKDMQMEMNNG